MMENLHKAYKHRPKEYLKVYNKQYKRYQHQRIRFEIVLDRMQKFQIKSVLDVGCGSCFPILQLLKLGYDCRGVDLTPEMIKEGEKLLKKNGFENKISLGDANSIFAKFDCIINLGAFPHVEDDDLELAKYHSLLNKGGKLFIEFRNELFGLFTFNKYTYELWKKLIPNMPINVDEFIKSHLILSEPDLSDPYYSSNPKLHNPLTIQKTLGPRFRVDNIHFYHYHFIPPIFENICHIFDEESYKLEKPHDWTGYFKASAFVVEATKI